MSLPGSRGYSLSKKAFVRLVETIGFGGNTLALKAFQIVSSHIAAEVRFPQPDPTAFRSPSDQ